MGTVGTVPEIVWESGVRPFRRSRFKDGKPYRNVWRRMGVHAPPSCMDRQRVFGDMGNTFASPPSEHPHIAQGKQREENGNGLDSLSLRDIRAH